MLQPHVMRAWGISRIAWLAQRVRECGRVPPGRNGRTLLRAIARISKELATTTQQLRTPRRSGASPAI